MSRMFFILVVQVGQKSDKHGSYRHVFRVVKVIVRARVYLECIIL